MNICSPQGNNKTDTEYSISKSAVISLTVMGLDTLKVCLVLTVLNLVQK